MFKLLSWNVNGLRAVAGKGFREFLENEDPDVLCLQETKAEPDQIDLGWTRAMGYEAHWNPARKKGYSGTVTLTRHAPERVHIGIGKPAHDGEGRVLTLEFPAFHLVNVYTPNAQRELARLPYRMEWDDAFRGFVKRLNRSKPVVFCGDLNVAHEEIDLANPRSNRRNPGFTDEERGKFGSLLEAGFVDTFRARHPDETGHYSWWSYRSNARAKNVGWRIDYFGVARDMNAQVRDAFILPDVHGSDHCPIGIVLDA